MGTSSSSLLRADAERPALQRVQNRYRVSAAVVACAVVASLASSCTGATGTHETDKAWSPGRTPWGDPDLQGQWNSQTSTPLERPLTGALAGRETISEDEAEEFEKTSRESFDAAPTRGDPGTYNAFWRA